MMFQVRPELVPCHRVSEAIQYTEETLHRGVACIDMAYRKRILRQF